MLLLLTAMVLLTTTALLYNDHGVTSDHWVTAGDNAFMYRSNSTRGFHHVIRSLLVPVNSKVVWQCFVGSRFQYSQGRFLVNSLERGRSLTNTVVCTRYSICKDHWLELNWLDLFRPASCVEITPTHELITQAQDIFQVLVAFWPLFCHDVWKAPRAKGLFFFFSFFLFFFLVRGKRVPRAAQRQRHRQR